MSGIKVWPTGPLVGLSMSMCIKDVIEGRVNEEQIDFLITGTKFATRKMLETHLEGEGPTYTNTYWRKDPERGKALALKLWDEDKIVELRAFGFNPPQIGLAHWLVRASVGAA